MKKVNFIPQTDINKCLTIFLNFEIYKALTENGSFKGVFEPLEAINLVNEQTEVVIANKAMAIEVKEHILNLQKDERK